MFKHGLKRARCRRRSIVPACLRRRVSVVGGRSRLNPLPVRVSVRALLQASALVAAVALSWSGLAAAAPAPELVLGTWNLEHLAAEDRAGCRPRQAADYARLRAVAERLDADIVALQEVENAAAVARVFDPARYDIVVSERREARSVGCRGMPGQARTVLRTGFAIQRERLAALGLDWRALPPYRALGIEGGRWGTRIRIEPLERADSALPEARPGVAGHSATALELMSLHLKAGCAWGRLDGSGVNRPQCLLLRRQRGILEQWVDGRAEAGQAFALMGDFNRQLDQPRDDLWRELDDGEVCDWRDDKQLGRQCRPGTRVAHPGADLLLANAGRPFPYPRNPKYPYAIDHFVFGGDAATWVIDDSFVALGFPQGPPPSDHHPLRIRLRLPSSSNPTR
ncbi:hypothetical protein F2Q65_08205 [Thiohalocapsa marina]|uniref:Endonuclease/exonuclease/phosphatase domain-containing protein n=1 Tax=Thiohalocapsa marina TaxID=424902 RepID=A0A5M8FLQ5_9GAMM|nr:endonuclease/exonuclease/phosphatase family protein [Thiohalocapsa marina]KAA6185667.1 hypothetical protein F2Q65_08205 [Thiohalocapsa marina]